MTASVPTSAPTRLRRLSRGSRLAGVAAISGALVLAGAGAASAHVTVDPAQAEAGSFTIITVKVPNESATAATERVELALPTDTPFAYVSYVPVPGWTTELVTTTLPKPVDVEGNEITEAVTSVVWTAGPGAEITEGQLQTFDLSVGYVPDTGSIVLPAVQTYTDGEVVEWTETEEGAEHPAPVVYVNDAPAGDHHGGTDADTAASTPDSTSEVGSADAATPVRSNDDILARLLAIGGLVVGAVGVVLAVTSRRRTAG